MIIIVLAVIVVALMLAFNRMGHHCLQKSQKAYGYKQTTIKEIIEEK